MTLVNTNSSGLTSEAWTLSVDFGTTSTVAALTSADGSTEVLEVDGERRTPSVVLVDDDGTLVVGAAAVGLAASRPERTIRAPKRRLGEQTPVVLGGKPYNPVDLVASVLHHVMAEAQRHAGSEPSAIRLTHPATWSRPLQQRLLEAAAKAGMTNVDLVPEPVAAAMAAADRGLPTGSYIAVYDLGGGTFDTTVVQSTESGYVVVGHPIGDRQIGGELFDEALMNHVGSRLDPEIWEKLQVSDQREWHQAATRLLGECRRVKEALSNHGYGEIVVGTPSGMIDERITRDELEALVAPYLDASVDLLERCVDDVGIDPSQLSAIHMIGGASRMPLAATMVEAAFPGVEVSRRGDPRTAVARGAAMVDLSAVQADIVADHKTTLEKRQRSIDAEAAAMDSAKANQARTITPPANPSVVADAEPDTAPSPPGPSPAAPSPPGPSPASPSPPALPTVAPGTVADPAAAATAAPFTPSPQQPAPQPSPVQAAPYQPPAQGFTSGPAPLPGGTGDPTRASLPILLGAGIAALLLVAGLVWFVTRSNGSDGDLVASPKDTASVTTAGDGETRSTQGTSAPDATTTSTTNITTTTEPAPSTTVAPVGGPTRDDAVSLLFDVSEVPGEGWVDDTYDPQPLNPCDVVDPHAPVFSEGRTFAKNLGQVDVTSVTQAVFVYANETEAATVLDYYQTFSSSCPNDTIDFNGTEFTATFLSCDPFDTCPDPLPAATQSLLAGDQFALQFAFLTEPITEIIITDQVYLMRIGRSIMTLEYVLAAEPTPEQFSEATTIALEAWGRANNFPR